MSSITTRLLSIGLGLSAFGAVRAHAAEDLYSCKNGEFRIFEKSTRGKENDKVREGFRSKISGELEKQLVQKKLHPSGPTTDNTDRDLGFAFYPLNAYASGDYGWEVMSDYEPTSRYRSRYFYFFKPEANSARAKIEIWEIADGARHLTQGVDITRDQLRATLNFDDCDRG